MRVLCKCLHSEQEHFRGYQTCLAETVSEVFACMCSDYKPLSPREQKFMEVFHAELRSRPDVAPSPTRMSREMGWSGRNLPGWASSLRIRLLRKAGFIKKKNLNRWYLP